MRSTLGLVLVWLVVALVVGRGLVEMTHGYPPWSGVTRQTVFSLPVDMGELAVRQGSPVIFDRRGTVVLIDTFEDGAASWTQELSGTGSDGFITAKVARTGAYSYKLIGGSTSGFSSGLYRWVPTYVLNRCGLSVSFTADANVDKVEIQLWVRGAGYLVEGALRWDHPNTSLEYLDSGGAWQTIDSDKDLISGSRHWHAVKLVVDPIANTYSRALVNETEYYLGDYELQAWAAGQPTYLIVEVLCYSKSGKNAECCIDDVVVTVDEP